MEKNKYEYIPKEAIDDLSYTMGKVSKKVNATNVLSGVYVKSASKVKAKTKGSSDLRAKILAMMPYGWSNKKVILSKDVKEMQKYVSDTLITAFYLGMPKAYDFKGDYEYSGGLVNYEEDYAKKIVVDALKNIKANKFEMGLKYPQYNFEKLLGKPIIKDIEGKSIKFSSSTRTYTYRLWIWKDCVIGQTIGRTDSKDGYSDYTYGEEPTLMGGYKSVQTSKASKLESIAKFMAKDKDGYLKDNDVLYNGLGGANFDALDKNKIKYEKGGEVRFGKQEVKNAQEVLNNFLPNLVRVAVEKDADGNGYMIVGYYDDPKYGSSSHSERLDRYYSMDIFLNYFLQRKEYMLASKEDQLAFDGHPAFYGDKDYAKGGEVKKKGNEMLIGGLVGILIGIFTGK